MNKTVKEMLEADSHDDIVHWLKSQTQIKSLQHLYGVAERLDYHPEADSGIHLEMCMEQAWRWCDTAEERAAVLLHDIGKAVTGRAIPDPTGIGIMEIKFDADGEVIPTHAGHDAIGAKMMPGVFEELDLPREWQDLAVTVARRHQQLHGLLSFQSNAVIQFVNDISCEMPCKSRGDAISAFTRCVRADFNGRLGFESLNYVQGDVLIAAEKAMALYEETAESRAVILEAIEQKRDSIFKEIASANPDFSLENKWKNTMISLRSLQKSGDLPVAPDSMHTFVGRFLSEAKEKVAVFVPPKPRMM